VVSSQGRSNPKVKAKTTRYQPDIAVLCSASSNVCADLGKTATQRQEGFGLTGAGVPTEGANE
jgi:hypothetical protein